MRRAVKTTLTFLGLFVLFGAALFVVANWQAISAKLAWWFGSDRFAQTEIDGLGSSTERIPADDRLVIPKLDVNVPLMFPGSSDESVLLESLQDGVVHYPGTALPGQVGNVFITGHSSQLTWQEGGYKDVFALLDKLEAGDEILVYYKRTKYVYKVTGERTVEPSEVRVLEPTVEPTLSLMTCWPIGTIAKRLVVTGELVSDDAKAPDDASGPDTTTPRTLPAVR